MLSCFAAELGGLALRFAPLAVAAGVFLIDLKRIQGELENDAPAQAYIATLGLTEKEMAKLKDTSVTMGDVMSGVWKTITDGLDLGPMFKSAKDAVNEYLATTNANVLKSAAQWYGAIVGAYRGIVETWRQASG